MFLSFARHCFRGPSSNFLLRPRKPFYADDADDDDDDDECAHHVLDELLQPKSDYQHNLRKRRQNLTLTEKKGHLAAKNFIIRLLYKDTY